MGWRVAYEDRIEEGQRSTPEPGLKAKKAEKGTTMYINPLCEVGGDTLIEYMSRVEFRVHKAFWEFHGASPWPL